MKQAQSFGPWRLQDNVLLQPKPSLQNVSAWKPCALAQMHHTVTARAPSAPEESCAAVGDVGRAAAAIAHQQLTSPPRLVMVMAHGTTAGNGQMSAYEAQSTDFRAVRVGFFFFPSWEIWLCLFLFSICFMLFCLHFATKQPREQMGWDCFLLNLQVMQHPLSA